GGHGGPPERARPAGGGVCLRQSPIPSVGGLLRERARLCAVGGGGRGHRHILAYKELADSGIGNVEVVALCDVRPENAALGACEVERLFGRRPMVLTDLDQVLASPHVVAVDVVTDPFIHHAVAGPALRAGKYVLVEKLWVITVCAC